MLLNEPIDVELDINDAIDWIEINRRINLRVTATYSNLMRSYDISVTADPYRIFKATNALFDSSLNSVYAFPSQTRTLGNVFEGTWTDQPRI